MITGIEFYRLSKETTEMYQLTNNTIVLCNNSELKYKIVKEFLKIKLDETEEDDNSVCYSTIVDDNQADVQNHKAIIKTFLEYKPTSIFIIDNEQKFIFTTEAPFILQCKEPYDLWFCDTNNINEVQIYSLVEFKGYKDVWNKGVYNLYESVLNGSFGGYEEYGK